MTVLTQIGGIRVSSELYDFINEDVLPGTGIDQYSFWVGFAKIITDFTPRNQTLLEKRQHLQEQINHWHKANGAGVFSEYKAFLKDIGYLVESGDDFLVGTQHIDPEVAIQAGPQLVVPLTNARFALNAANARWGSLYDALYGSDAIPLTGDYQRSKTFNLVRGERVAALGRQFLDEHFPLATGSHAGTTGYVIRDGELSALFSDDNDSGLQDPSQLVGFQGEAEAPTAVLLKHNHLHVEVQFDKTCQMGSNDRAGINDIVLEAALTTIIDLEDSIAAVDAADKVFAYRNWLGLMKGNLEATFTKNGKSQSRSLAADRHYLTGNGEKISLKGRSLLFIRNVGLLMKNPAVLDEAGGEVYEGIMDAVITSLIAMHDLKGHGRIQGQPIRNSEAGSIYIVKPKLHGPEETAFTCDLFTRVEGLLGLPVNTLKIGIMDEERRTSVNLQPCIAAAKDRVAFINTGFLDRTGDEIHTSMYAGAFATKNQLKLMPWIDAYEDRNVDVGLKCGLQGKAQIGKGMWAMPDNMADMMAAKIAHPQAGANTAWVPSPTAATLHAMHYHEVDVISVQQGLLNRPLASVDTILEIPLLGEQPLTDEEIRLELDNNCQGILGYVVRWIDQGVGCSKVPNINDVGLMEDRATLRISNQHIANWLLHGVCTEAQVVDSLQRMAAVVDQQNAEDTDYVPMAPSYQGRAFQAASDLIFKGADQPNGYTEPLLHGHRLAVKANKL